MNLARQLAFGVDHEQRAAILAAWLLQRCGAVGPSLPERVAPILRELIGELETLLAECKRRRKAFEDKEEQVLRALDAQERAECLHQIRKQLDAIESWYPPSTVLAK